MTLLTQACWQLIDSAHLGVFFLGRCGPRCTPLDGLLDFLAHSWRLRTVFSSDDRRTFGALDHTNALAGGVA